MPHPDCLSPQQQSLLMATLKARFGENPRRHENIGWENVQDRLEKNPDKLLPLLHMEQTGGEPDVVGQDPKTGEFIFCDCSPESPKNRRSCCYDRRGWEARKEFKPQNNAVDMAAQMGIELLSETEYLALQQLGDFDLKSTSWLKTPEEFRKQGEALFANKRNGRVFVYYNGAQSYYSSRGFRGIIRV